MKVSEIVDKNEGRLTAYTMCMRTLGGHHHPLEKPTRDWSTSLAHVLYATLTLSLVFF